MVKIFFTLIFVLMSSVILGQTITNGSFENPATPCPAGEGLLSNATGWSDPFVSGGACGLTDLYNSCYSGGGFLTFGVPASTGGTEPAHTGNAYAGIMVYQEMSTNDTGLREYIQTQLSSPLTAGQVYCLSVWISLADNSTHALSNFGVKFTNTQIAISCPGVPTSALSLNGFPADVTYTGAIVNNTNGWTELRFDYTAVGGEQYMTFGNFDGIGSLNMQPTGMTNPLGNAAYYYVDDVSISQGSCTPSSVCDSTINSFGPLCSTDAASNMTAVTAGGTWVGTGITSASAGTFDPATAGIGTHEIVYTAPCGSSDTVDVIVNDCSTPVASFTTSNTSLCESDCISFSNSSTGFGSGATFSWTFTGAGTASSTAENPSNICYPTAGTYPVSLTVTDGSLTDDTTTVSTYITVTSCAGVTVAFSTSDDTICQEGCVTFTNNSFGTGVANYGWNFDGGTPSTYIGVTPPQICFDNSGNYTVTLVAFDATNSPIASNDTLIVVESCVVITPTVNFTVSNATLCENDCVSFTDQSFGIVGTPTYNWSFPGASTLVSSAQNPTNICYPEIGVYTVTLEVTDNNGTGDTTITNIITVSECEHPVPSFSISSPSICTGQCVTYVNSSTNSDSYEWIFEGGFPGGSLDENPSLVCYDTEGEFTVTLIATNTLTSDTLIQSVVVLTPPTVDASDSVIIFQGTNAVIGVETDGESYIWSPSESLNCEDCLTTNATPDSSTLYTVTVTAANGCALTDSVMVTVVPVVAIGLPTAFSPNGDQVNDVLRVEGAGIEKINLTIYNRYGEKVFESNEQSVGWDGRFRGKDQNPGIFVYTLEYVLSSGETGTLKGNVTLVK